MREAEIVRIPAGLHVEWVDEEAVVLDLGTKHLHYLNPMASLIYAVIQEHGYKDAVALLERTYGAEPDMKEELQAVLDDMKIKGLLVDD